MGDGQHGVTARQTALFARHNALGARMAPFAGWEMPLQYGGILQEHRAVREAVGLFDVSHMGRLTFVGPDAERLLDYLSTNIIVGKKDGIAIYTVFTDADGGCVDDAIVYREQREKLTVVVNAANREKDLAHFHTVSSGYDATVPSDYSNEGILALQGPHAEAVLASIVPEVVSLRPMHFFLVEWRGVELFVARTGYTGSDGFELSVVNEMLPQLWDLLLEKGEAFQIEPCGLGARDTLRLEAGFALYGHELGESIAPTESVSAWTVKFDKHDFLGAEALRARTSNRCQYGVILRGGGIARQGYPVYFGGQVIGEVTSGSHSPSLNKAIAIVMVQDRLEVGQEVEISIRNKRIAAEVTTLPFYSEKKKKTG